MNRLKLWLFVLLLLGAGTGNLYFLTGWLTARSVAHIDRELRSGAAVADARIRLLGASAGSIADAAARSPAVAAAVADPAASPLGPAEDAVEAARAALRADGAGTALVAVAGPQGVSARAGGSDGKAIAAPEALLAEAQAGRRAQAWVRLDGTLWMVAAVPAGRNGAVAVGLPLDQRFAQSLQTATGVHVTATLDGTVTATTEAAADAGSLAALPAASARRPVDVGRLGKIKAALDWPAPEMPLLFAAPPAVRALALPLEGAGPATLVLSQHAAPFFSGLAAYQLLALVAMALFLLVGVLLGLFMSEESTPKLPRELVAAADRIGRGDFSARAPALGGRVGSVASALNRAAEAAQRQATQPAAAEAQVASARPPAVAPAAAPTSDTEPEAAVTQPLFTSEPAAAAAEPSVGTAATAVSAVAEHQVEESAPPPVDAIPELGPQVQEAAQVVVADADEPHWRSVYEDFVRLRGETGEPAGPVDYERFRARLERNREQLKDKHGARTVRFQPYLKEGKAALRATPVR